MAAQFTAQSAVSGFALLVASAAIAGSVTPVNFDSFATGQAPHGFNTALTGDGGPVSWIVQRDSTAPSGGNVLAQTSRDTTNNRFPLCIYYAIVATDVSVSVRFKPVSGTVDQAAGIVWRYQDAKNYYIVRANALESNVVLYKVENGKRSDLKPTGAWPVAYGKKAPVPAGQWSKLAVVARGARFEVHLNGEHLFDVEDTTFPSAGNVGLWTKADSVTSFDDFSIEPLDGARP